MLQIYVLRFRLQNGHSANFIGFLAPTHPPTHAVYLQNTSRVIVFDTSSCVYKWSTTSHLSSFPLSPSVRTVSHTCEPCLRRPSSDVVGGVLLLAGATTPPSRNRSWGRGFARLVQVNLTLWPLTRSVGSEMITGVIGLAGIIRIVCNNINLIFFSFYLLLP